MKLNRFVPAVCICTLMALPAAFAARPDGQETGQVLSKIQQEAWQVRYHAEQLQSIAARADAPGWPSDLNQLESIRTAVNRLSRQVGRLQTVPGAVPTGQQADIGRIAADVTLIADNTQDALNFGDHHRETLWSPTYQQYVARLYREAQGLTDSVASVINAKPL